MDCLLQYTEKCLKTTYDIKKEKNVSRFCEKKKKKCLWGQGFVVLGGEGVVSHWYFKTWKQDRKEALTNQLWSIKPTFNDRKTFCRR